jgi:uracil-DNA glycosylase family 4
MAASDLRQALIDALAFQAEAGVDVALNEEAVDRFAASDEDIAARASFTSPLAGEAGARRGPSERQPPANASRPPSPALPHKREGSAPNVTPASHSIAGSASLPAAEEAVVAAREAAKTAATLDDLRAALERFEGCALRFTAKQLVFADGNPQARVMFVGEAPGADEDREGLPFVGRAGKLLDRMLAAIELDRKSVYIANIVPWRPPGNRTPTPQESAICFPFIRRQIELANPDILVCLGGPSAQTLLGVREGITRVRGRWFDYDTGTRAIKALATLHPAYLLRSPAAKRLAWRDMLALKKALERQRPSAPV